MGGDRFYKCHCPLFCCHLLAFALSFGCGIYLLVNSNFLASSLVTAEVLRRDDAFEVVDAQVADAKSTSNVFAMELRLCLTVVGGVALGISLCILCQIWPFLSLILGPGSDVVRACPCCVDARRALKAEIRSL